ncbi:MAG: glycogen synthase [Planctomycetes bacterium]|nr:glycogen synthase [Planctomycetota bacterium]
MRVCLVASEAAPFAKTGGLGDVAAALARYLVRDGHDARLFLPLYGRIDRKGLVPVGFLRDVPVRMGDRTFTFSVWSGALPQGGPTMYFVECAPLFGRQEIYSQQGDEHLRFGMLSRAALESCQRMGFAPHVVHCNDWHTALIPLWLRTIYKWDRLFAETKTVLTLHNLAYQGGFPKSVIGDLSLRGFENLLHQDELRAGRVSFLTSGLLYADALTVVSPTHSREVQTAEYGFGLDGILRARGVTGILNGVDYDEWSPERDRHIAARYSPQDMSGKAACRRALLAEAQLAGDPQGPVFGVVSRLTSQKGLDLVPAALARLLASDDVRLVALGSGDQRVAQSFRDMERQFPGKVRFREGYDEPWAHRIEAGADAFLMPSRFEPCGLNQMYSLRYGTVPIVRNTGGLADSVTIYDPDTGHGTGIVFDSPDASALRWAAETAARLYRDRAVWRSIQLQGMAEDFSWTRQIQEYTALYRRLCERG